MPYLPTQPPPTASVTAQQTTSPFAGTITVSNPVSLHTYSFDNGTTFQASRIKSGLAPATYQVKVKTTATGCISAATPIVISPPSIAPPISGQVDNTEQNRSTLFPNPTTEEVNLDLWSYEGLPVAVYIYSSTGILVLQRKIDKVEAQVYSFDVRNIAVGTYTIHIQAQNKEKEVKQMVIMR